LLRSITRFIAICCAHARLGPSPALIARHGMLQQAYFARSRAAASAASANPRATFNAMPCVLLYARWNPPIHVSR
jgi:hypothetical protein